MNQGDPLKRDVVDLIVPADDQRRQPRCGAMTCGNASRQFTLDPVGSRPVVSAWCHEAPAVAPRRSPNGFRRSLRPS